MQGAVRRQGPSLAKRRNAADALSRCNPSGRSRFGRIPLSRSACSGWHCGAARFAACIPNRSVAGV